eukprot:226440-Chlamydomonas_euryale.AAC.2
MVGKDREMASFCCIMHPAQSMRHRLNDKPGNERDRRESGGAAHHGAVHPCAVAWRPPRWRADSQAYACRHQSNHARDRTHMRPHPLHPTPAAH